jgi:hypothetical protein
MKVIFLLVPLALPGLALAQNAPGARPTPAPAPADAAAAFAVAPPDEGSPFFAEREAAKYVARSQQGAPPQVDTVAVYPRVKNSSDSASAMFGKFFTEMFSSINFQKLQGRKTTENLTLEPSSFSLGERREIEATYTLRNNSNKLIRLDYPTAQRMDILTRDSAGQVIDRWSDDRAFQPQEGIVIINPKERIEYREKVPTRDMKADTIYTIQAEVTGHPEYTAQQPVTPKP